MEHFYNIPPKGKGAQGRPPHPAVTCSGVENFDRNAPTGTFSWRWVGHSNLKSVPHCRCRIALCFFLMGACLSLEESHPPKVAKRNQTYSKSLNNRKTHRVPSSSTTRKKTIPHEKSTTRTKQEQLSKTTSNNIEDRVKSTPTRRSTSKPNPIQSTKESRVLREVNRGSKALSSQTLSSFTPQDSKETTTTTTTISPSQPKDSQSSGIDQRSIKDEKPVDISSFATPWVSGSLVQQRMSQLFQNNSFLPETQDRENIQWKGLVQQRQSMFQNHKQQETEPKQDISKEEKKSSNSAVKELDNTITKSFSFKENATPWLESAQQPLKSTDMTNSYPVSPPAPTQRKETPILPYPNDPHRHLKKQLEETSSLRFENDSMDAEKWRNRRTRRMVRNSVMMDEQEDPEEVAARSMRGSVLRAHSSMKFQF